MDATVRPVAVVGGVRIPFCRSNTLYADQSNLAMLTATLNGLVDKYNLKGVHIDEAIGGAVVTHSKDWNLAREAILGSKLAPSTPGITLQQACGTSLQAAMILQAKIATGQIECGIAMGSDTTSDAPIVFKEKFAHRLVEAQNAKSFGQRLAAFKGFSPAELAPQPPSVSEPRTGLSMGQHTELMAQEWQISRADQDRFALESHRKAAEAYRSGYLDDLVVPFAGVFRDNNLREDISLDRLATLKPAFDKSEYGTLTAANSTPLTDGAACVLLASQAWAASRGLPVEAYLTHAQTAANNFVEGEGLLLAPTIAVSRMLERAQLTYRTSTSTRSTKPSRPRCSSRSKPSRIPATARGFSAARQRWVRSIAASSMSRARAWPSAIHLLPPGPASSPTWASCSPSTAGVGSFRCALPAAWASPPLWKTSRRQT